MREKRIGQKIKFTMKHSSFALVLAFLLTACGGETTEGMTPDDMVTSAAAPTQPATKAVDPQPAPKKEGPASPVPAAFWDVEVCSFVPTAAAAKIDPCFADAKQTSAKNSAAGSQNYDYKRYASCAYLCTDYKGMLMLNIYYNGKDGGALSAFELKRHEKTEQAGTNGVYFDNDGLKMQAVKGNYRLKIEAMVGGDKNLAKAGKDKLSVFAAEVLANLPE